MQGDAVDRGVAGAGHRCHGRHVAVERPATGFDHASRRGDRRARWRVDLVGVVQLDDLGRVEVLRRDARHVHHQHRAQREVGSDHAADLLLRALPCEAIDVFVGEAGRADDRPHAVRERGIREHRRPGCVREVDDHVGFRFGARLGRVCVQRDVAA